MQFLNETVTEKLFAQINIRAGQTLIICAVSMFSCQLLKFIIMSIRAIKPLWHTLWSTGGMPSSHTSTVITLVFCLGIFQLNDNAQIDYSFVVAFVFAVIVIHDAMGVRLEASKHARILNNIVKDETEEVKKDLGYGKHDKLKELLGHKPLEVFFGSIYGVVVAVVGCLISMA